MKERKRRWKLLAFVVVGLLVVALLSFGSTAWATPAQDALHQTVFGKVADVCQGVDDRGVTFTILLTSDKDWTNVTFVDEIPPMMIIDDVIVDPPADSINVVDNRVEIYWASLSSGAEITITVICTVDEGVIDLCPLANTAVIEFTDDKGTWEMTAPMDPVYPECFPCFVPEGSSILLLGSGLAGLAGYAGMKWRGRKR
jgi:hypothetical protein